MVARLFPVVLALTLAACLKPMPRVAVAPGSRPDSLVFLIQPAGPRGPHHLERLAVAGWRLTSRARTPGPAYWVLLPTPAATAAAIPAQVRYGRVPAGYTASGPAPILFPMRYEVDATVDGQPAVAYFRITPTGRVE